VAARGLRVVAQPDATAAVMMRKLRRVIVCFFIVIPFQSWEALYAKPDNGASCRNASSWHLIRRAKSTGMGRPSRLWRGPDWFSL
jgi:hypothetical protein